MTFELSEIHKPVLLQEILQILNPQPGQTFIDATVNGGGHASAILGRIGSKGKLLGIDRDRTLIDVLPGYHPELAGSNVTLAHDSFANLADIAQKTGFEKADGILFDLGFSTYHIEQSGRGFSFLRDEPLDMRYDPSSDITAETIINEWPRQAIENILREFGEERFAGRISRAIVEKRRQHRIVKTGELAAIIARAIPGRFRRARINPATRTFQAFRIAVNDELNHLQKGLDSAYDVLGAGGIMAVIAFHSLEDRLVKHFFRKKKGEGVMRLITEKPVRPEEHEKKNNPRARSAKLRSAQKI